MDLSVVVSYLFSINFHLLRRIQECDTRLNPCVSNIVCVYVGTHLLENKKKRKRQTESRLIRCRLEVSTKTLSY